jgi:hypothetical protein
MFLVVFGVRVTAYALSLITSFLFSVSLSVPLNLYISASFYMIMGINATRKVFVVSPTRGDSRPLRYTVTVTL